LRPGRPFMTAVGKPSPTAAVGPWDVHLRGHFPDGGKNNLQPCSCAPSSVWQSYHVSPQPPPHPPLFKVCFQRVHRLRHVRHLGQWMGMGDVGLATWFCWPTYPSMRQEEVHVQTATVTVVQAAVVYLAAAPASGQRVKTTVVCVAKGGSAPSPRILHFASAFCCFIALGLLYPGGNPRSRCSSPP